MSGAPRLRNHVPDLKKHTQGSRLNGEVETNGAHTGGRIPAPREENPRALGLQSLPFCSFKHEGLLLEKVTKSHTI